MANRYEKDMKRWAERRQKIVKLRDSGMTFTDIGKRFDMSRQRVAQIYKAETEK
jgi:DNA-directed RNA polymerase specialized sigma subunit